MKTLQIQSFCDQIWENQIIPELTDYIRIPNKSPAFDPDWQTHGYMDKVVDQFVTWSQQQNLKNMTLEVVRLPERTPLIYIEIAGEANCE